MNKNKKQPPEAGAAGNDIFLDIFKAFADATKPENEDGTPVKKCPFDDMLEKVLDGSTPLEALDKLAAMMSGEDLPEDAEHGKGASDPAELAKRFKKISSVPIFKELPTEAQDEILGKANEGAEQLEEMLELMQDFAERPEDEQAAIVEQMEEKARQGLLTDIRQTVAMSTNTKDGDAFLYRNLQEDPSSLPVVADMTKGIVTRAARAAAVPIASGISMSEAMLPADAKVKRDELKARLGDMVKAATPETVAAMILEAIPQTFGYFKEHAPERAAALEEYARDEVKKAFAPIVEYVAGIAEPVEGKAPGKQKESHAEREKRYGNTNLIPIDAHREPKDKLTRSIFPLFGGEGVKIGDIKKAINVNTDINPVYTYLSVIPDPDFMEGIRPLYGKGNLSFSREHWRLYRAVMTEILQGNEWTTFSRLYQIEYHQLGRTKNGAISKEKEKEMMDMLYFFQNQFIEADITGEKEYYRRHPRQKSTGNKVQAMEDVPKGALINFEIWAHYINHNYVKNAIHFLNVPVLLKYAIAHNHLATIPPKLFQNKRFKRQTEDASDIADMLIHWLMMKDVREYRLAYETVFNYMGIKSSDRTAAAKSRRTRLRNTVYKWMEYWSKDLHLFSWDANNADYIRIILPKEELEKKKHTLLTAEKIKALM